jgi:flagellar hook-associated protein 1
MTPQTQWSADPSERLVGTLTLTSPTGGSTDLLATKTIRSGRIAALVEMRDQVLVEAQTQLDAVAAAMAQALSSQGVAGAPVSSAGLNGFDIDLNGLLAGNTVSVTYTDIASGQQRTVSFVRVDDADALPLT